ncbi:MAG: hypothetical protein Q9220_004033 [cf. Caloplaca sp. 1 TL-2023]
MALRLALSQVPALHLRYPLPNSFFNPFAQPLHRGLFVGLASGFPLRFPALPSFLSDLWESLLHAVPKKKTSHRKKRQRFLAGKALQDVTSLNKCSACGNVKRAHLLCPYCVEGGYKVERRTMEANDGVAEIRTVWKKQARPKEDDEVGSQSNMHMNRETSKGETVKTDPAEKQSKGARTAEGRALKEEI